MRIGITILSNRDNKAQFTASLANMLCYTNSIAPEAGIEALMINAAQKVSLLSGGRQAAINYAREKGCTHIFYLDDDMTFPANTLEILVSRKVRAIGANYVRKSETARKFVAYDFSAKQIDSRKRSGIEKIAQIGFGVILFDLKVFSEVPEPHFEVLWNPHKKDYVAEDNYCCRKLNDAGIDIYVDHDVSKHVGHIGDYVFKAESYGD